MSLPKVEVRRGLAGLLWQQMAPVNQVPKFKELYKDKSFSILYRLTDQPYCALITVQNGTLDIKHVKNDKESVAKLHPNASMTCSTELFFAVSGNKLYQGAMFGKMLTGKLKIKGAKQMQELAKIMALLK